MNHDITNPFIISGKYISEEYFCDREAETRELVSNIQNWRNSVLVSPRRMGKSGLIEHVLSRDAIAGEYETFYVDIYATSSLEDLSLMLGKAISRKLRSKGSRLLDSFVSLVTSVRATLSADPITGAPSVDLSLGEGNPPAKTLEQIFAFMESSSKPCVLAIDEFQQIAEYPDGKKVIAMLRTLVQECRQTRFIFAGSNRRMMGKIFNSPSEPFFMSCSPVPLEAIRKEPYREFALAHFRKAGKEIAPDCFDAVYDRFEGHTWYVQYVLNRLYEMTACGETAEMGMIGEALDYILGVYNVTFQNMLAHYSERQKGLLAAVAHEGRVQGILSGDFISAHRLQSSSSVQGALRPLLEDETIVKVGDEYYISNRFFSIWMKRR